MFCMPFEPVLSTRKDEILGFLFYFFRRWNELNHSRFACVPFPRKTSFNDLRFFNFLTAIETIWIMYRFLFCPGRVSANKTSSILSVVQ